VVLTVIIISGLLLTVAASAGADFLPFASNKVMPNVYAGPLELEGMTREQGVFKLLELEDRLQKQTVTLMVQEERKELPLESVDLDLKEQEIMDRALRVGRTGPIWKRWNTSLRTRHDVTRIPLDISLDQDKLQREVDSLLADTIRPPVDATFRITPGDEIEIIPGEKGLQVDHESLYHKITEAVAMGTAPYQVEVLLQEVSPKHTVDSIKAMGIKGLLASYSTKFDPGQVGRTYNVRVAAAALDGLMVAPGEEVSFNDVVGPRSTEAGYKNAKIILNNEFVDGLGGGVCQVSSTLYNAVLLADLEVTERNPHSLPVGYVPIGRDATVAYGYLDFSFKNNHDSYILIKSNAGYNSLTFKLYGNTDYKKNVTVNSWVTRVLEPEVVYEEDPNLEKGEEVVKQEGIKGYKTAGEITVITRDGKKTTKPLPESVYQPQKEIIAVGTKESKPTIEIPEDKDMEAPAAPEEPEDEAPAGEPEKGDQNQEASGEDELNQGNRETTSESEPAEEVSEENPATDDRSGENNGEDQGEISPEDNSPEDNSEQGNENERQPGDNE
jgi:vancomycin resistance protein YoaR